MSRAIAVLFSLTTLCKRVRIGGAGLARSSVYQAVGAQRGRAAAPSESHWFRGRGIWPWVYAFALVLWASSWDLRLSVLMAWMPIEPVWVASLLLGACVVHRMGRPLELPPRVLGPIAIVVIAFLPGALHVDPTGYGPTKVARLLLVVLPVVLSTLVLLDSAAARRAWATMQVVLGVSVAAAAVVTSHVSVLQPARFTLATVNTIPAGRFVGVALVVTALSTVVSIRSSWWRLPVLAGVGMVLVQIGSRGPLLFAIGSVLVVVAFGRLFAGRRLVPLLVMAFAMIVAFAYATSDGGTGGRRVVDSLEGGLADRVRSDLLADAVRVGLTHPFGIGWGDFLQYSPTARQIANSDGVSYAHNVLAEAFVEGGFLALLGLGAVMVLAVARQWSRSSSPHEAVVWATLVFWIFNSLVSLDLVGNRFLWISLACALACGQEFRIPDGGDRFTAPSRRSGWSRRRHAASDLRD